MLDIRVDFVTEALDPTEEDILVVITRQLITANHAVMTLVIVEVVRHLQ